MSQTIVIEIDGELRLNEQEGGYMKPDILVNDKSLDDVLRENLGEAYPEFAYPNSLSGVIGQCKVRLELDPPEEPRDVWQDAREFIDGPAGQSAAPDTETAIELLRDLVLYHDNTLRPSKEAN